MFIHMLRAGNNALHWLSFWCSRFAVWWRGLHV